jgi:hypothetical protein
MDSDPQQPIPRAAAPGTIHKGRVFASEQEHGRYQFEPKIPAYVQGHVEGSLHQHDFAPQWDRDTDTLASFLAWKSAQHHNESSNITITALLGPICQFVRTEVQYQLQKHSFNVKIPGLQEMKDTNVEMQKHILQLTDTITKLSEQVAILSSRPVPTATSTIVKTVIIPPRQTPPIPTKPNKPTSPTYAQVVQEKPLEFTEVRSKKMKAKQETVLAKPYPIADRMVIFSLTTAPNNRKEAADRALQVINKTITNHTDILDPPFILANISATNNLVFTTAPQQLSINYEPYLKIFEDALHEFPITSSRISQRWTRFIIHGIPTTATPEDVRTEIENTYPALHMGQTPRWLTNSDRRQGKVASSMVITLVGEMTKKSLGATKLAMFNRLCDIAEYISFGPSTRCNKCQLYGHPTQRCTADHYACAVCAQPHSTKDHPCGIGNCKAGHACNHPTIRCVSCQQPHKASDRNCPTYVKIVTALRQDNMAAADATMTA